MGIAAKSLAMLTVLAVLVLATTARAEKKYDQGASDGEIKIGNIAPYSGPVAAVSTTAKVAAAYFKKINDDGGVAGRKLNFISYDDGYSPPKTFEQARKLVESDGVLLVYNAVGTSQNAAIQKYLNGRQVPQLFVGSGAARWDDPKQYPWTMGWSPSYRKEGKLYAKYILKERPDARIAILYQNDDLGRDYLKGLKEGLQSKVGMIVAEESFEVSEPTVESHVAKLRSSGADVLLNIGLPKSVAQTIRKVAELGWTPLQIIPNIAVSLSATIEPVGVENAQGVISSDYLKDPSDAQWVDDEGVKRFKRFLSEYAPNADSNDKYVAYGYSAAQTLIQVLVQCGDDLTRENIMRQAQTLREFQPDLMIPGVTINTSPTDFAPLQQLRMMRIVGKKWEFFGAVLETD